MFVFLESWVDYAFRHYVAKDRITLSAVQLEHFFRHDINKPAHFQIVGTGSKRTLVYLPRDMWSPLAALPRHSACALQFAAPVEKPTSNYMPLSGTYSAPEGVTVAEEEPVIFNFNIDEPHINIFDPAYAHISPLLDLSTPERTATCGSFVECVMFLFAAINEQTAMTIYRIVEIFQVNTIYWSQSKACGFQPTDYFISVCKILIYYDYNIEVKRADENKMFDNPTDVVVRSLCRDYPLFFKRVESLDNSFIEKTKTNK